MPLLKMRDFITFRPKSIEDSKKHFFECKDSSSDTGHSLLIRVAATHSGLINGNDRFYRPDRMQDSVKTFLPSKGEFARPVLIGHNEDGVALGRVLDAKYVDTSYSWAHSFPTIKDSLFYRTDSKKVGLYEAIDWIVDNLQEQDGYAGLGYIDVGMKITNPEAIRKVLADEYLTVSVGFKTDSAICSICHQDWSADGRCDHSMGDSVDKKPAFLITGNFFYEEVSFVNFPADPFAGVISKDKLADSLNKAFFLGLTRKEQSTRLAGERMTDSLYLSDLQVEDDMALTTINVLDIDTNAFSVAIKDPAFTQVQADEVKKSLIEWKPEKEEDKLRKRSMQSTFTARIKKNGWDKLPESGADSKKEDLKELEEALKPAANGSAHTEEEAAWDMANLPAEDQVFFSDEEGIYAELEAEIDAAVKAGELVADSVKDAKLSGEQRKKLASGTFCGPGRSFPVPDCAHVTAARRLIGRAKVSESTKSKILACVSRKASSLSCGAAKKDDIVAPTAFSDKLTKLAVDAKIDLADADGKEILGHYSAIDKAHDSSDADMRGRMRGLHGSMLEDWYADEAMEWHRHRIEEGDKDHVVISKTDIAEKDEIIITLTEEATGRTLAKDAAELQAAGALKALKQSLASQIVIYKVVKGAEGYKDLSKDQVAAKVDELSKRHVTSLRDSVADVLNELKWEPTAATRTEAPPEVGRTVKDNVQLTDTETAKTPAETEAETRQRVQAAEMTLREKLRYMTPSERNHYLGTLKYEAAKKQ